MSNLHLYQRANALVKSRFSAAQKSYLLNRGSLTQALIQASEKGFAVKVLSQGISAPTAEEARVLKLRLGTHCLIREVALLVDGKPWVYARSVIPLSSVKGSLGYLRKLQDSALGALLFKDPHLSRSHFELFTGSLSDLCPVSRQQQLLVSNQQVVSRRSLFLLRKKPLLVAETFLSDCRL